MGSLGNVVMVQCTIASSLKHSISRPCFSRSSFGGLDQIQQLCIVSKRCSPSGSSFMARSASSTVVKDESLQGSNSIPTPNVIIDQDADPDATVVEITFGDRLGALLDTMNALKNLGLNVLKGNVCLDSSGKHTKFAITKASTGRKVEDPELLEAIRLTIINNLLEYHPESSALLAMGSTFGVLQPTQQVDVDIATQVHVYKDGPDRSLLVVEAADRPGLLVDLVKIVTDVNIAVESGEFDTVGLLAKAKFHVSYKGKAISKPLQQVLENSLRKLRLMGKKSSNPSSARCNPTTKVDELERHSFNTTIGLVNSQMNQSVPEHATPSGSQGLVSHPIRNYKTITKRSSPSAVTREII